MQTNAKWLWIKERIQLFLIRFCSFIILAIFYNYLFVLLSVLGRLALTKHGLALKQNSIVGNVDNGHGQPPFTLQNTWDFHNLAQHHQMVGLLYGVGLNFSIFFFILFLGKRKHQL